MSGPLEGLRVLDLSIMAAGPWTGALLGELGAEVIKVEPPAGDGTRWVQPLQHGMGTNYISMNVNKRGTVLDLKDPAGRRAALDIAARCDVLVQNFRVGAIDKLGLGYTAIQQVNPRLVYCSISGFGSTGPLARERCADFIMQAFSGFARINGSRETEAEAFRFTGYLDLTTAIVAVEAILAALLDREQTGQGQHVDVSMLEAALEIQYNRVAEMLIAGQAAAPMGSQNPAFAPDRVYATVDRDVFVSVRDQRGWRAFCDAIEQPELADRPELATNRLRVANRELLDELLEPVFAAKPAIWWLRALRRVGVAAGLGQHVETFRHHSQVTQNQMIAEIDTRWGPVMVGGLPWQFSQTPCQVTPPPEPGGDTDAVRKELT
ncbi:MAG TPA: CoA transferase [Trebonia sp.]|jgi:crotonobetainyl-CoA:carnitine CoA-transferase CaiB-like acyl-CoA transferase|nr:CoA transferase [Trebonia sp.]